LLRQTVIPSPIGQLELLASDRGLVRVGLPDEDRRRADAWLRRRCGPEGIEDVTPGDDRILACAATQLGEYFARSRRAFDVPLDLRGTPFQVAAWEAICAVPWGQTRTYRDIAASLGMPAATRAVGAANGANPVAIVVPCHRLIGADGTLRGYGGGLERKAWLLAHERCGRLA
jgi:O-6-methylguanine DNA methyltransferase